MRQLLEAIGVHLVLSGDARRNRDDYLDLVTSLPFQGDVNTGFGSLANLLPPKMQVQKLLFRPKLRR
jgi:hypothetical protein